VVWKHRDREGPSVLAFGDAGEDREDRLFRGPARSRADERSVKRGGGAPKGAAKRVGRYESGSASSSPAAFSVAETSGDEGGAGRLAASDGMGGPEREIAKNERSPLA
jgi:hypothetical protein